MVVGMINVAVLGVNKAVFPAIDLEIIDIGFFVVAPWFPFFKCAIIQDIRYGIPVNSGERKGVQNDWAVLIRIITSDFYSV